VPTRFGDRSPAEIDQLRRDIAAFRNPYVGYVNDTLEMGSLPPYDVRRKDLERLAVRADLAVSASGLTVVLEAPPRYPRPSLLGVANIAFAHEDEAWQSPYGGKPSYVFVVEMLDQADAYLEVQKEEIVRRRRSPFYWGDRFLRAVLGFPAYLISLIGGFDRRSLSPERASALWLVSVAADAVTLYLFGRFLGWW
jgi:hypothetical protein